MADPIKIGASKFVVTKAETQFHGFAMLNGKIRLYDSVSLEAFRDDFKAVLCP